MTDKTSLIDHKEKNLSCHNNLINKLARIPATNNNYNKKYLVNLTF
jgi:hypothetical protein